MPLGQISFNLPWATGLLEIDAEKYYAGLETGRQGVVEEVSGYWKLCEPDEKVRAVLAYAICWGDGEENEFPYVEEVKAIYDALKFLTE